MTGLSGGEHAEPSLAELRRGRADARPQRYPGAQDADECAHATDG